VVEECEKTSALKSIINIATKALESKSVKQAEDFHAKLMNIEFELNH